MATSGMPSLDAVLAFAALSFALIIVPGPSVTFIVSRAVAHGRRVAVLTVFGNTAGVYLQALLVAVGLGAVLTRSIALLTTIKLAGAAYLVYLGVHAIRASRPGTLAAGVTGESLSSRRVLREGFLVGLSNPKAVVFFAAILPQFVDESGGPVVLQMSLLGLVFAVVALVADGGWALGAGAARDWFVRSPVRLARLRRVGGAVMIGLGMQLAISGRRS